MRVELYKLMRKKTTYLLLIPLLIPVLYGIGINSNLELILNTDGQSVEFISRGIGLFEFVYTMISTANFFFLFILVVIGSMLMAREVENKEINLYVYRIGKRFKIVWSKFIALQLLITVYYMTIILLSTVVYLISSDIGNYGILSIFNFEMKKYVIALLAIYLGTTVISAFNLLIGTRQKSFTAFSITFILYIISMYFDNFSFIKKLFPEHFAKHIALNGVGGVNIFQYILIFIIYVIVLLAFSVISFRKKEL